MLKNYLVVALRSIIRNKLTAFINIFGLALSLLSAILIYLFVSDELSYDKHHTRAKDIYRVTRIFYNRNHEQTLHLSSVAPPFGPLLKNDFGEIEQMARTLQNNNVVISKEQNDDRISFTENNIFLAEPALFQIFDIETLTGNPAKDLSRPRTVMLSEHAKEKYFKGENPVGKRLRFDNLLDLEVVGTFRDFKPQTHWHPDFLISFVTLEDDAIYGRKQLETNWGNNAFSTYLLLSEGTKPETLAARFPAFIDKHYGTYAKANYGAPEDFEASKSTELTLQKVTDVHLKSHLDDEIEVNGNINNVYMISLIGIFIVLIACFNFVNLSTAQAATRSKEVGLRKVVGAFKIQLINQYLSESALIALFALVLASVASYFTIDWLNQFTGKSLSVLLTKDWPLLAGIIGFTLIIGLLAGIYPAFVLSGFKPAHVLKGQQGSSKSKGGIRRILVTAQFAISITLTIATTIVFQQLGYLNSRNLGYDRNQVITFSYNNQLAKNYDAFYNEALKSSAIKNMGRSSRIPTGRLLDSQGTARVAKGDSLIDTGVSLKYIAADHEFFHTYGIELAAGREFSKTTPTDDSLAFIVNEAATRAFGWKTPAEGIDKDFLYGSTKGKLIGVVKDFHFESLHEKVVPMIFVPVAQAGANYLAVKIGSSDIKRGVDDLEKLWKEMLPEYPFEYQFLDERYSKLYAAEQKESTLFLLFSGLAIFIACLGLFGLATFNTLQRVKEIGIRKVMGASIMDIVRLLSKEVIVLIALSSGIAWLTAWYLMSQWLESFAYHVNMSLIVYILAAVGAISLALLTVGFQTLRAAMSNPSATLRNE